MSDLLQNVKPQIRHLQKEKHTHTPRGGQRDERKGKHGRTQNTNGNGTKKKGKLQVWSINSERRNMRHDKQARKRKRKQEGERRRGQ